MIQNLIIKSSTNKIFNISKNLKTKFQTSNNLHFQKNHQSRSKLRTTLPKRFNRQRTLPPPKFGHKITYRGNNPQNHTSSTRATPRDGLWEYLQCPVLPGEMAKKGESETVRGAGLFRERSCGQLRFIQNGRRDLLNKFLYLKRFHFEYFCRAEPAL